MNPATTPKATRGSFPKLRPLLEYLDMLGTRADLATLSRLLADLDLTRDDLAPACVFGEHGYRRNRVKETDWYELVCLCWRSGQRTPIHDHAGSSCAFCVIEGVATVTSFERSPSGLIYPASTEHHDPGYVCASREADIHQVANIQPAGEDLINLHIYSPQLRNFNVYSLDTMRADEPGTVRPSTAVPVERPQ
ncbi:MAG: cysteine dioxygenase family protein [Planctomycetes bacterium]|nr:cysteine dioxygenase family protein [Planctomycetota bacterium]